MSTVSIIIVNWNSGEYLEKCVDHLRLQTLTPDRIIIVDNASTDKSLSKIIPSSTISIIKLHENIGFAAANNIALSHCATDFVALLNPDAFPNPTWLECLVAEAEKNPRYAAFGSVQLCAETCDILDGAGDCYHISGLVWRQGYGKRLVTRSQSNREIFSPCAAAALYRRYVLLEVGGFDEDYFCYVEDVDLGFRLRLMGYRSMLVGNAVVKHIGSASTGGQHSDFAVYHGHRNLVWTFVKNMPAVLFWVLLPAHLFLNVISILIFSFRGRAKVIIKAKFDAIKGLPIMWKKRQIIQRKRVVSSGDLWKLMNKRLFRD